MRTDEFYEDEDEDYYEIDDEEWKGVSWMANKITSFIFRLILASLITVIIAISIDYFIHLLFTDPMETLGYFTAKFLVFFVFSLIFFSIFSFVKLRQIYIIIGGIVVALIWGTYYNILPAVSDYSTFGIPLSELAFFGFENDIIVGLLFGITHVLGFFIGANIGRFFIRK